jgi:transcriptional regulator with XRE-family HTH domain
MTESIYEFVMQGLQASKGKWPAVAEASGVSLRTISKIARKEIENPGISNVEKLANYFRENPTRTAA